MRNEIIIEFIQHDRQHTEFDWANIIVQKEKVGQVRCLIESNALTIFSIKVFPDYQGLGYASKFIEKVKKKYDIIIADRVRVTSSGFWDKMGFVQTEHGKWVYLK
jgi:GNAT superfamily N-acetyltransferase